jgi:hypothetical protein
MSVKTLTATQRFLTNETRRKIDEVTTVDWPNEYAANIEDRLRRRGETDLAETYIAELEAASE